MGKQVAAHQPCPDCGSSDALAIYEGNDGKVYTKCFSSNCKASRLQSGKNTTVKETSKPFVFKKIEGRPLVITERNLNRATTEFFGVVENEGSYCFPYHDDEGNIIAYKKRSINDKKFWTEGQWSQGKLFGQSLFPMGQKTITICEGEFDAMSAFQMMGSNTNNYAVVSVRNGAGSALNDCKQNYEYLDSFETIYVCFDADKQGQDAANQVSELFGAKVKVFKADPGFKDASDYLQKNLTEKFNKTWWRSERFVPDGIVDGSTLWDEVNRPVEKSLVNYPYSGINKLTYGIRPQELVLCTAGSGLGKSQFMRELVYHILQNTEDNIGLMFLEESVRTTARSMMSLRANKLLHLPQVEATQQELREAFDHTLGTGRLFLLDHFGSSEVDRIVNRVRYMAKALDCKYIFLDHVSIVVSSQEYGDERRNLDSIMTKLRELVQETGICLFAVSHLKRPEGKGHEEGAVTSMSQLRGSAILGQVPNIILGLERNGQAENEEDRHTTRVRVLKNRFCGMTGPACNLLYNRETGRMTEKHDEDAL